MTEEKRPTDEQIEGIKKAMVAAGFLKATKISPADEAKITDALTKEGAHTELRNSKIICSWAHWCLVIPRTAK